MRFCLSWRKGEESAKRDTIRKGETGGDEVRAGALLAAVIVAASTGEEEDDSDTMVMGLGGRFFE